MNLKKKQVASRRISLCGTLLAFVVINASIKNSFLVLAAKEEVDERGLLIKPEQVMGSSSVSGTDDDLTSLSNPYENAEKWKPVCFYFPNHYDYDPSTIISSYAGDIKRNFNPWGGKRSGLTDYFRRMSELTKKGGFNPWGGKREASESSRSTKNDYPSSRRLPITFNPWGGR